ncbi:hypothetical protein KKA14_15175, partial [bacterium]|nr:hypothetical protein [bacterium]
PYVANKSIKTDISRQESSLKRTQSSVLKKTNGEVGPSISQKKEPDQTQTEKDIDELRKKISSLLRSRNEGISLFDIGKAIGEKESRLRDIADPKSKIQTDKTLKLENILFKIEKLYQREYTDTI